ncbi:MAG: LysR substrate-binding domain-containing protein [Gammaproteobacteria bacterium]|nr:LysR substrate-binding domain-containing protein [Gammaproteobacteria bacterium]
MHESPGDGRFPLVPESQRYAGASRELRDHNYLVYTDAGGKSEPEFVDGDKPCVVRVEGNMSTNNTEALRMALIAGLGISRAPRWLVGDVIETGELVPVLEDYQPSPISLYAVYSPGRHLPSRVRTVIDFFAEEFRDCSMIGGC